MAHLTEYQINDSNGYDFFQIVRIFEELPGGTINSNPWENGIHFLPDCSISYPPNDISSIKITDSETTFILPFMSLTGITSPLPAYFTEFFSRNPEKAEGWYDFLVIFNHRIYSLFYQAWKKYNFINLITGPQIGGLNDKILSLAGIPVKESTNQLSEILSYSRYFLYGRSTAVLKTILQDFFEGISIHIEEFVPRTVVISNAVSLKNGCILGKTAVLGRTMTDYTGKFRIIGGPVSYEFYQNLLLRKKDIQILIKIVNNFLSEPLQYDILILMDTKDLKPVHLGTANVGLGLASSLGSAAKDTNIETTVPVLKFTISNN